MRKHLACSLSLSVVPALTAAAQTSLFHGWCFGEPGLRPKSVHPECTRAGSHTAAREQSELLAVLDGAGH